ncbi:MAG: DUF5305 domain-containing protein [Halobacteriota archaeon]
MTAGLLRLRLLIAGYARPLAVGLAVVGLFTLGASGWVMANPETVDVTESTAEQRVASDLSTGAVVTGDSELYEAGTTLENRPVYFVSTSPRLSLALNTTVPDGTHVTQRLSLVVRLTRDGDSFWTSERTLAADETTTSGENVVSAATLDVSALQERLAELREETSGVGTLEVLVVTDVSYDTGRYSDQLTSASALELTDNAYWVDSPASTSNSHSTEVTSTVTQPPDLTQLGLWALFGVGCLGGAWLLELEHRRGTDPSQLTHRLHERRCEEWISEGELPVWAGSTPIKMASLQELVDLGIDTNTRVIYDPRREVYAAIQEDLLYYYSEQGTWTDFPGMDVGPTVSGPEPQRPSLTDEGVPNLGFEEDFSFEDEQAFEWHPGEEKN